MVVRSKKELIYDSRGNKSAIIALKITDWVRSAKFDRFTATVEDMVVRDVVNPESGSPQKTYEIISRKEVVKTNEDVNNLFNYIGIPIEIGDNFNEKIDYLIAQGLLIDTQTEPIYSSVAEDWEIIDETLEIEP
jgi:hypothetical protein